MENPNNGVPPLPPELEQQLISALQKLCVYLHDTVGISHVLLDIKHVSDALNKQSQTLIAAAGMGVPIMRAERSTLRDEDPQKLAQEAIARALKAAKNKEGK